MQIDRKTRLRLKNINKAIAKFDIGNPRVYAGENIHLHLKACEIKRELEWRREAIVSILLHPKTVNSLDIDLFAVETESLIKQIW